MSPSLSRRIRRPRIATLAACLVIGSAAALSVGSSALATSGPYTIDGSVPDAGTTLLPDAHGKTKELGPINSSTTKIGVIQNASTPMLGLTNPNAQVDLVNTWLKLQRQGDDDWLYFAWQRDSNSGSGFIAFEFMKDSAPAACDYTGKTVAQLTATCNPWKNRQGASGTYPGDFMIIWDQSGSSTQLYKRVWSGTRPNLTLGEPIPIPTSQAEAQFSPDGYRGEAAIDLTQAIYGGVSQCITIANVIPSTVTGNSDTADYKDTVLRNIPPLSNCQQTVTTTPSNGDPDHPTALPGGTAAEGGTTSIGNGVVAVRDHAVVGLDGGSGTASGTISFRLCKVAAGTCGTGPGDYTDVGSVGLTGAYPVTVDSPTAYVTAAGRYCWQSTTSGDVANGAVGVDDSPLTECFTVTKATPSLSTDAGPDVILGHAVTDTATLSGTATDPATPVINLTGAAGPAAGGSVAFTLNGPSSTDCGAAVGSSGSAAVHGDGDYATAAPQVTPTSPGDYHWVATYSGSANNNAVTDNAACDETSEDVTVSDVAVGLDTTQSWVPNDAASLSAPGGGDLSGTATFTLYPSADCSGTPVFSAQDVAVSGASPQTVHTTNTHAVAAGTYSWKVAYDSTNEAQRDIPTSCQEVSTLTVSNGSTVHSP